MKVEYSFKTNYASAQEHVPQAERNNRVIKERVRAAYHYSPFKKLPRKVLKYLVMECTRKLNFFPVKGGVSNYYSPREIIHKVPLDYNTQCAIAPLSYVLAHNEPSPSNTLRARAIDALYLRPLDNTQGGHLVYNVDTEEIISRRTVTEVPITTELIARIDAIGNKENMKSLKIENKTGQVLYDSDYIAGVDHPIQNSNDNYEDYDYDSDIEEEENIIAELEGNYNEESNNNTIQPDHTEQNEEIQNDNTDFENDVNNEEDENYVPEDEPTVRRSTRQSIPPSNYEPTFTGKSYGQVETENNLEYTIDEAKVLAMIMCQFNERMNTNIIEHGTQCVTTYSLKKGIEMFGNKGKEAALKEMKQMHDRNCFQPIKKETLNSTERKRALESLIFLTEKRDGTIKARHCANGSTQRDFMNHEEVSSPTVSTESTLLTAVIEAEEGRDVATCDIPNAFIQTEVMKVDKEGNRTIMKIRGTLVDILCEMDKSYKEFAIVEGKQKVLYVHVTKAIYGLLVSAMLFYKKLVSDLQSYGFEVNPYDPCVANKDVKGNQMTVSWHVDDLKVSHKEPKVIDDFLQWVKKTYGNIGEVKTTRGKVHDYLGMKLDYTIPGQVKVDMIQYVESMISNFPEKYLHGKVTSPWNENLFKVQDKSPKLDQKMAELFHTVTAQGLFLCKRARPDISPAIAYLTTRVKSPNQDDWDKLTRMMKFLNQTTNDCLTLKSDSSKTLKWHVDASFAVHPDMRSHTGATMSMGQGAITAISRKQGMNTRSSTEAEVVAADEIVGPMLWTKQFLECQGYPIKQNILFQDNRSAMLLEQNGRKSVGKRSRHLNIRYFFVTDQKEKGNISIQYCPTEHMTGDYMTKPVHGKKFKKFRQEIMNLPLAAQLMMAGFIVTEE